MEAVVTDKWILCPKCGAKTRTQSRNECFCLRFYIRKISRIGGNVLNKYFNCWGLIFVIIILIPNIVFAVTCKDGFENRYQNKVVEVLEQIGRFGCFFSMFILIPYMNKGYWFKSGKTVYLILGFLLAGLYCLGWLIFWKENSIRKSLYLSILPSVLFIESGIISGNALLLIFAAVFAPCHILISYMNVVLK